MARKINVKAKREPMPTIIGAGITDFTLRILIATLAHQRRLSNLLDSTYLIMISRNSFSVIANGWLICPGMENSNRRVRGRENLAQRGCLTQEYTKYLQ